MVRRSARLRGGTPTEVSQDAVKKPLGHSNPISARSFRRPNGADDDVGPLTGNTNSGSKAITRNGCKAVCSYGTR